MVNLNKEKQNAGINIGLTAEQIEKKFCEDVESNLPFLARVIGIVIAFIVLIIGLFLCLYGVAWCFSLLIYLRETLPDAWLPPIWRP